MMRRAAYAAFERMILDLYEQRILTLSLLDCIASKYRPVGIDTAGTQFLRTQDGKDLHQVCIELIDPSFPLATRGTSEDHEEYWERELKKWEEIVHERWGWQDYCTGCPVQNQRDNVTQSPVYS